MNPEKTETKSIGKIELKIENISREDTLKYQEILAILVSSGALALKNAQASLFFDGEGVFQGLKLDYWAFKRKHNSYDGRQNYQDNSR